MESLERPSDDMNMVNYEFERGDAPSASWILNFGYHYHKFSLLSLCFACVQCAPKIYTIVTF